MFKFSSFFILVLLTFSGIAQDATEEQQIKKVIDVFFDGLHQGDSTLVGTTLHKDIKIQTTYTNKKGEKILVSETRQKLLKAIASKKSSDTYFEKLLSYQIQIDGNLASVWTPYEFYLNDTFSHCGANSFQLFNNNGKWEIIYLVDMRRRQECRVSLEKK
ncbi:nuclear transport factor 2 family protein [Tenacibaculum agarivorans]|uniref:nuclear transport factor 2 family protein n=1 Tax=Tenacibaculum agarivorans TaxID=1908389 RepID=UPI00094BA7FF|nr:nuclear transport factor 2 family protein [Tenacibaculum agarivorans]